MFAIWEEYKGKKGTDSEGEALMNYITYIIVGEWVYDWLQKELLRPHKPRAREV